MFGAMIHQISWSSFWQEYDIRIWLIVFCIIVFVWWSVLDNPMLFFNGLIISELLQIQKTMFIYVKVALFHTRIPYAYWCQGCFSRTITSFCNTSDQSSIHDVFYVKFDVSQSHDSNPCHTKVLLMMRGLPFNFYTITWYGSIQLPTDDIYSG